MRLWTLVVPCLALVTACTPSAPDPVALGLPARDAWQEAGVVLEPGAKGSWDARLRGMISPCAALWKDGEILLYYIGADGDRVFDGGPAHRALGVARSRDGVHFEKSARNPVLRFAPTNGEEEGVFSAAAAFDDAGRVLLWYGAMTEIPSRGQDVRGDVRLAVSEDGIRFEDRGLVLGSQDPNVWGFGDELFPLGAWRHDGQWSLYYTAKGRGLHWALGEARGARPERLDDTREVERTRELVGGGDVVPLRNGWTALLLLRSFDEWAFEVRMIPPGDPTPGPPVDPYRLAPLDHFAVVRPPGSGEWLMYYLDGPVIRLRRAPAAPDRD